MTEVYLQPGVTPPDLNLNGNTQPYVVHNRNPRITHIIFVCDVAWFYGDDNDPTALTAVNAGVPVSFPTTTLFDETFWFATQAGGNGTLNVSIHDLASLPEPMVADGLSVDTLDSKSGAGITLADEILADGNNITGVVTMEADGLKGDTLDSKTGAGITLADEILADGNDVTGINDLGVDGIATLENIAFDAFVGRIGALGAGKSLAGTAKEALLIGSTTYEGMALKVLDEVVACSQIENAMTQAIPKGAMILAVNANADVALTGGGTTATWSLGITGTVDKYGTAGSPTQADSLALNSKSSKLIAPTALAADETIKVIGAATGGAAAGDTALTVGSVRVQVIYLKAVALDDAA